MIRARKSGFTLIELLTVIAIIGVLLGLFLPVFAKARLQAKKVRAKTEARQLEGAWKQYLMDYRAWPGSLGAGVQTMSLGMVNILRGIKSTDNSRGTPFMEFNNDSLDASSGAFVDPWGTPYNFIVDKNLPNSVTVGATPLNRNVAVWSSGPNKQNDNGTSDDQASWAR